MWEKKNDVLVVGVGSLRLRSAQHPVSTTNSGCSEARQRRGQRGDDRDARAPGHEPVEGPRDALCRRGTARCAVSQRDRATRCVAE